MFLRVFACFESSFGIEILVLGAFDNGIARGSLLGSGMWRGGIFRRQWNTAWRGMGGMLYKLHTCNSFLRKYVVSVSRWESSVKPKSDIALQ